MNTLCVLGLASQRSFLQKTKKNKKNLGGIRRVQLHSHRPNMNNNITVATMAFHDAIKAFKNMTQGWIKTGMVNTRSIKGKELPLLELILEHGLDLMLTTESWLRPEVDDIWKKNQYV